MIPAEVIKVFIVMWDYFPKNWLIALTTLLLARWLTMFRENGRCGKRS